MKTEEEIREILEEHKKVRDLINPASEDGEAFIFQEGFISALTWVLCD